jgi:hypothetical protein
MTKLITPVGELQRTAAKSMRNLADKVQKDHQGMMSHKHLRDAARVIERGQTEGAKRHLDAAVHEMQPNTLYRHGLLTDEHHALAKQNMGEIHRHRLLVRDIEDVKARNQENIARMRSEAAGTSIPSAPEPSSSVNAPSKTPVGRIDINVASGPKEPPPTTSQNHLSNQSLDMLEFAAWEHELRGPKGEWISTGSLRGPRGKNIRQGNASGTKFTYKGGAGSFSHARAIKELGDYFAPTGEISTRQYNSPDSIIIKNALRNAAVAMVKRDMPSARAHFGMAIQSAARLGPQQEALVMSARDSLDKVPPYARSMRSEPRGPRNNPKQGMVAIGQGALVRPQEFSWTDELRNRHGEWSGMSDEAISAVGARHGSDVASHLRAFKTAGSKPEAISHLDAAHAKISANMRGNRDATAGGAIGRQNDARLLNTIGTMRKQASAIEMSAQTARLAVTPAPRGKPGGPGLYDVKGLGHTPYLQQVVKALIEKRGMEPGKAYAIARASIRKWMAKSKHPEVKAAAGAAEAGELAKQAQAHAHSNQVQDFREIWELANIMAAIDLTGTAAGAAKDQRIAAGGTGGGRFGSGQGQSKAPASRAQRKAKIEKQISNLRGELHGLLRQYRSMSHSSTPRKSSAAAASSKAARQTQQAAKAAAASGKSAAASSSTATAAAAKHVISRATLKAKIAQIRAQIHQLQQQAARL